MAQKFIAASVKLVRARASDEIDDSGAAEAEFSAEIRFLDLELFDGIYRRRIGVHANAAILLIVRGCDAVHEDVGSGISAAIGDEVVGRASHASRVHFRDAGSEERQIENAPSIQREIVNELPVYNLPGNRVLSTEQWSGRGNIDGLESAQNRHREIYTHILADVDFNSGRVCSLNPAALTEKLYVPGATERKR